MKIKKDSKFTFYASLIVSIGIIALNTYRIFTHNLKTVDLIVDLLLLVIMIECMLKSVGKK